MDQLYYYEYQTPIGVMTLSCIDDFIVGAEFGRVEKDGIHQETQYLKKASQQLDEYFLGERKVFDLNYRFLTGTVFQQKVWNALLSISYGQTASYQDIAKKVGSPHAARAIGNANHKNPIAIMIPCHRVIGANHSLVGYAGGLDKKVYLLNLERGVLK